MMRSLLAFAVLGTAVLASSAQDDKTKKELEKFKGTWKMDSGEKGGMPPPAEFLAGLKLTFAGDKLTVKDAKKDKSIEGSIVIDPSKSPPTIDVTLKKADRDETVKGIYKFEGNKLTLCLSEGGERPKEFSGKDANTMLMVFVRDK